MSIVGRLGFGICLMVAGYALKSAANTGGPTTTTTNGMQISRPAGAPPIANVRNDDTEMAAAHAKALAGIGEFWAALDRKAPNEKSHMLKVRFPVAGESAIKGEQVWVADVRREGAGRYSARLDNKPRNLPQFRIGDRVDFVDGMITDWMFIRDGKLVGNETMRVALARMPKAEAEKLRAMVEKP